MGKAVGNYFKGMFVANSGHPDRSARVAATVTAPSGDNCEEDSLVIGIEEEDLFLSEGEEEKNLAKELKYKDRAKQWNHWLLDEENNTCADIK